MSRIDRIDRCIFVLCSYCMTVRLYNHILCRLTASFCLDEGDKQLCDFILCLGFNNLVRI